MIYLTISHAPKLSVDWTVSYILYLLMWGSMGDCIWEPTIAISDLVHSELHFKYFYNGMHVPVFNH